MKRDRAGKQIEIYLDRFLAAHILGDGGKATQMGHGFAHAGFK